MTYAIVSGKTVFETAETLEEAVKRAGEVASLWRVKAQVFQLILTDDRSTATERLCSGL